MSKDMNMPIWNRRGHCVGYQREVLRPEVVELVLDNVHPDNLGALPPAPWMIVWKAEQLGLIKNSSEAYQWMRKGQFN